MKNSFENDYPDVPLFLNCSFSRQNNLLDLSKWADFKTAPVVNHTSGGCKFKLLDLLTICTVLVFTCQTNLLSLIELVWFFHVELAMELWMVNIKEYYSNQRVEIKLQQNSRKTHCIKNTRLAVQYHFLCHMFSWSSLHCYYRDKKRRGWEGGGDNESPSVNWLLLPSSLVSIDFNLFPAKISFF